MPKNEKSKVVQREYDLKRKEETLAKLKLGIRQLRRHKEHQEGKPITKYKLSKHTGVSSRTIDKYPEILDTLEKEKNPGIPLKNAVVNTEKIYSIEEAISIINQLTDLYNETKEMYNDALKKNSFVNLENVRLKNQVSELNRQLNKYIDRNR